jgi:subtilisin
MNQAYGRFAFSFRNWSVLKRIEEVGGNIQYVSRHCGIVSAEVPREEMRGILEHPGLVNAETDRRVLLPKPRVVGVITREGMNRCFQSSSQVVTWNVNRVWKGRPHIYAGAGVRVGVLDTGIDLTHPDLRRNIKGGINIVEPKRPPQDGNGHGTHVAGIIAAYSHTQGVLGVAPAAELYAIKVLNDRGVGSLTTLVQGIDWGIEKGMHILNLSLSGGRQVPAALLQAIRAANRKGVLVVAAAGNNGNAAGRGDTVGAPARLSSVMAVAAVTQRNKRAPFSATGPSLDISAPGVGILSTYTGGRYAVLNGTSQAAPHVSGVAAVWRQRGLSAGRIRHTVIQRAVPLGSRRWYGAGLLRL